VPLGDKVHPRENFTPWGKTHGVKNWPVLTSPELKQTSFLLGRNPPDRLCFMMSSTSQLIATFSTGLQQQLAQPATGNKLRIIIQMREKVSNRSA
jgi:hypothetical protein